MRCDTFRYWEPPVEDIDDPNWGECRRLIRQDSPIWMVGVPQLLSEGDIVTRRDFFCAEYEAE
jgi:hypothetical protein